MPDPIKQYYEYLKKAGADVAPTFESFNSTLQDSNKAKTYYDYLKSNSFDTPDTFESFQSTLGFGKTPVKKKGQEVSSPDQKEVSDSSSALSGEPVKPVKTEPQPTPPAPGPSATDFSFQLDKAKKNLDEFNTRIIGKVDNQEGGGLGYFAISKDPNVREPMAKPKIGDIVDFTSNLISDNKEAMTLVQQMAALKRGQAEIQNEDEREQYEAYNRELLALNEKNKNNPYYSQTGYKKATADGWVDVERPEEDFLAKNLDEIKVISFKSKVDPQDVNMFYAGQNDPDLNNIMDVYDIDGPKVRELLYRRKNIIPFLKQAYNENKNELDTEEGRQRLLYSAIDKAYGVSDYAYNSFNYPGVDENEYKQNLNLLANSKFYQQQGTLTAKADELKSKINDIEKIAKTSTDPQVRQQYTSLVSQYNNVVNQYNTLKAEIKPLSDYFEKPENQALTQRLENQREGADLMTMVPRLFPKMIKREEPYKNQSLLDEIINNPFIGPIVHGINSGLGGAATFGLQVLNSIQGVSTGKALPWLDQFTKTVDYSIGDKTGIDNLPVEIINKVGGILPYMIPYFGPTAFTAGSAGTQILEAKRAGVTSDADLFASGVVSGLINYYGGKLLPSASRGFKDFTPSREALSKFLNAETRTEGAKLISQEAVSQLNKQYLKNVGEGAVHGLSAVKVMEVGSAINNALLNKEYGTDLNTEVDMTFGGMLKEMVTMGIISGVTEAGGYLDRSKNYRPDVIKEYALIKAASDYQFALKYIDNLKQMPNADMAAIQNTENAIAKFKGVNFPEGLSVEQKVATFNVIDNINTLKQQKAKSDPEFHEAIDNQIKELEAKKQEFINNPELAKSEVESQMKPLMDDAVLKAQEYAITESKQQEGTQQGNRVQPTRVEDGQPKEGQGEGKQGQGTEQTTNVGDSNIGSQGLVKDVESTAKALQGKSVEELTNVAPGVIQMGRGTPAQQVAEAYHKAADGSNPELRRAVNKLLGIERPTTMEEAMQRLTPEQKQMYLDKVVEGDDQGASAMLDIAPEPPKVYTAENVNTATTEGLNETQAKVVGDAKTALPAISGIVKESIGKDATLNIHKDDASFGEAVVSAGGSRQDATSKGFYLDGNGNIHLNMQRVTTDTMLHESFHPLLDFIQKNAPEKIQELYDQLKGIKGIGDLLAKNERLYKDQGITQVMKESITDFFAQVRDGKYNINASNFEKVKNFVYEVLNKIGLGPQAQKILNMKDAQELKDLINTIGERFATGEQVKVEDFKFIKNEGDAGEINGAGILDINKVREAKIGDINPLQSSREDTFEEVEVNKLPVKSLEDVYNEFGGRAIAINSDPTRVGRLTLPSGREIFMYGGPRYMALKPNVDNEVGFASTRVEKARTVNKFTNSLFGDRNNEGVVFVTTQKPESMMGNAYSLEYVLDAITKLPKKVLKSSDFKNEFFGKDIVAIKDAFGEKEYDAFIKKFGKADFSSPEVMQEMVKELLTDIGNNFVARNSLVDNLLAGIVSKDTRAATKGEPGYISVTPNKYIAKELYDNLGLNQEKLFYEIGEKGLVDAYMNEGKWGYIVGGFTSDGKIDPMSIQDKGIIHPQFNAKFHGRNPFLLDGAYSIDKLWKPEVTYFDKKGQPYKKPYEKKASLMVAGSMYPKGAIEMAEKDMPNIIQLSRDEKEIYHMSNEDVELKEGSAWFTTGKGYVPGRSKADYIVSKIINPNNFNLGNKKDFESAGGTSSESTKNNLIEKGFDGVKYNVDRDTNYWIFDVSKLNKPQFSRQERIDKVDDLLGKKLISQEEYDTAIEKINKLYPPPTSVKNATVDEERAARGQEPVEKIAKESFGEWFDEAKFDVDNGYKDPKTLAQDIVKNPRAVTPVESATLLYGRMKLNNERAVALQNLERANASGDQKQISDMMFKLRQIEAEIEMNDIADSRSGSMAGKALVARKMMLADDYSLTNVERRMKAANGGKPLDPELLKKITNLTEEIRIKDEKLKELEAKQATDPIATVIDNFKPKPGTPKPSKSQEKKTAILDKIRAKMNKGGGMEMSRSERPNPLSEYEKEIAELAKYYVEEGVTDPIELVQKVREDVNELVEGGVEERDVQDVISGYGKRTFLSQDELAKQMREIKQQLKLFSALEDVSEGRLPEKSGLQRDQPSDEVRRLRQELNDAIKNSGLDQINKDAETQYKTALDAVKKRLNNQIKDLENQIATGDRRQKKEGIQYDQEAIDLRNERDRLRGIIDAIDGKEGMSAEQRLRMANAAIERGIQDLQNRIANKDFSKREKQPLQGSEEEMNRNEQLKNTLNQYREEYNNLRQQEGVIEKERLAKYKSNLQKRLGEYETKLANKDFAPKPKKAPVVDEEVNRLKKEIAGVKFKIEEEKADLEWKNKSKLGKGATISNEVNRGILLSSLVTLGKIATAGAYIMAAKPIESLSGSVIRKLPWMKAIADKAPREGQAFNPTAEVEAITQLFKEMSINDLKNIMAGKPTELEALYGEKTFTENERTFLKYFGRSHAAIKYFPKTAEIYRSFRYRANDAIKKGEDIKDPVVYSRLMAEAILDGKREIFMGDNSIVDGYKAFIRSLESRDNLGSNITRGVLNYLLPIVKVPTNYVKSTGEYLAGTANAVYKIARKGVNNLEPQEADMVMRLFKKNLIGAGFLALGYLNPNNIGGYYTGKREEGDLEAMDIEAFGIKVPHWATHHPLMEVMQFGSTLRRLHDAETKSGEEAGSMPTLGNIGTAGAKLIEEVPFLSTIGDVSESLKSDYKARNFIGNLASRIVPPDVKRIAKMRDVDEQGEPIKRRTTTVMEKVMSNIPGIREKLPEDPAEKKRVAREKIKKLFADGEYEYYSDVKDDFPELTEAADISNFKTFRKSIEMDKDVYRFYNNDADKQIKRWSALTEKEKEDYSEFLGTRESFEKAVKNKPELLKEARWKKAYEQILEIIEE